jgi:hypothetical protein
MRFIQVDRTFCRDCGLAVLRTFTGRSLLQGWWGLFSFFINIVVLLSNLVPYSKLNSLSAPEHRYPGANPPLDPGKPLLRRPAALGFLIPILLLAVVLLNTIPNGG